MPTFEMTAPDGAKYRAEAPDAQAAYDAFQKLVGGQKPAEASKPQPTNEDIEKAAGTAAGSALQGIPILGAGVQPAEAGLQALMQPLTGAGEEGATIGERYAKNREASAKKYAQYEKDNPVLAPVAQTGLGVAATLPVAATGLGARALGLGARTLPGEVAAGAASGGVINAADAALRGNDPITSGAIGVGVGGATPLVARGVGMLAAPVARTLRGISDPAAEAERRVATAIQQDQQGGSARRVPGGQTVTDAELTQAAADGQPITNLERGGELTRGLARSAANTSPEGRGALEHVIETRYGTQAARITDWLRSRFNFPNAHAQQQAIDNVERVSNSNAYGAARAAGEARHPGGIWSPELEQLTGSPYVVEAMQEAVKRGQGRAVTEGYGAFNPGVTFQNGVLGFNKSKTGVPLYPDLRMWDETYRVLRDKGRAAFAKGEGDLGNLYSTQANQLRGHLDTLVPEFGHARAGAARFFGAEGALEAGQNFAMPSAKFANDATRQALRDMNPLERQLFEDGFIDRLSQQISERSNRLNAANAIGTSDALIERLHMAVGPQRAREIEAMMRVEQLMDLPRQAVRGNSTTARQLTELGLAGGADLATSGGNIMDPQALMHAALVYGTLRGQRAINERVSNQVARLLASNDPARIANGMRMIAQPRFLDALRQTSTALARVGSAEAEPRTVH